MQLRGPCSSLAPGRSGKTLVLFALLLPVLLGMAALVIDCGLVIAAQRSVQNAADSAALAAAMAGLSGGADPQTAANTFLTEYSGLSGATLAAFNNPPAAGPHAGSSRYYEVVVAYPVTTLFLPALDIAQNQSVQARAVAGREAVPSAAAVAALDPSAAPGLAVNAGAAAHVNGRILVNSMASPAVSVDGGSQLEAAVYSIVGGTVLGTLSPYPGTSASPALNQPPAADPLINLATPATNAGPASATATPLSPSWSTLTLGSPVVGAGNSSGLEEPNSVDAGGTVQLYPGVYQSITVTGGTVNLNPGVYILSPSNGTTYALNLTGGTITANGVMFYNTGGDFVPGTGAPDNRDASLYDPGPSGINVPPSDQSFQGNFAAINIDASSADAITLAAMSTPGDPFRGTLLYQRRANTQPININGGNLSLTGTLYAKWAALGLSGGGSYQAQLIAGSVRFSGQDTLTLTSGAPFARADNVFLTE